MMTYARHAHSEQFLKGAARRVRPDVKRHAYDISEEFNLLPPIRPVRQNYILRRHGGGDVLRGESRARRVLPRTGLWKGDMETAILNERRIPAFVQRRVKGVDPSQCP